MYCKSMSLRQNRVQKINPYDRVQFFVLYFVANKYLDGTCISYCLTVRKLQKSYCQTVRKFVLCYKVRTCTHLVK